MISESEQASIQRNVDMDAKFFKKHLDRKERNNKTLKTNFLYLSHFYFMTSQAEIRMFLVWF